MEFLDYGAGEDPATFEYTRRKLLFRELSAAGEAVVTAADDVDLRQVSRLDLDKSTVYKSPALILL